MTVTEQIAFLRQYRGEKSCPPDFEAQWREALEKCTPVYSLEEESLGNPVGIYETMELSDCGKTLTARCIHPADGEKHPMVLMYHDLNRGVRGWHHMTRFLAFGYGVAALEAEPFPGDWRGGEAHFRERCMDALVFGKTALELPWVDSGRIIAFGEGFGGGLALAAAAVLPNIAGVAALNPFPGDTAETDGAFDLVQFAPLVRGQALVGTCLLDEYAPPKGQAAIFNSLNCEKLWRIYPKYGHERVNAFENDLVWFLKDGLKTLQADAAPGSAGMRGL